MWHDKALFWASILVLAATCLVQGVVVLAMLEESDFEGPDPATANDHGMGRHPEREVIQAEPAMTPRQTIQRFVRIEPGTFRMGGPADENRSPSDHSGPVMETLHTVRISRPFWMKSTEVTQREWTEVAKRNPSKHSSCGPDCPVELMNWWEIIRFLNMLSLREGLEECYEVKGCRGSFSAGCPVESPICCDGYVCDDVVFKGLDCDGYRLPSDAEWEYVARAGTKSPYFTGRCISSDQASFDASLQIPDCPTGVSRNGAGPMPVASYPPNPWGVYDMNGNIWEWVWDHPWDRNPDSETTHVDPLGGTLNPNRNVRGGGYDAEASILRSAYRGSAPQSCRYNNDGFRYVRTILEDR